MNKDSIIFSSTLNYVITILLLVFSFIFLLTNENYLKDKELIDKYRPLFKVVEKQRHNIDENFKSFLKDMNYELYFDKDIKPILKNKNKKLIFLRNRGKEVFKIFVIDGKNYLLFERSKVSFLIKDIESSSFSNSYYLVFVFFILFFVLTFLYIRTLKQLLPLKILKDKVINLGDEKFDFEIKSSGKNDEITILTKEFKNSAKKLKNIKESRNVFIRNIMHELKTPITKGKILLQLEQNEENSEKLKMVFNRLEALINEFATIEELISQNKILEKKSYFLEDLLDEAKDILMLEDSLVKNSYENIKLFVNFRLFSIAIKNLIDNAIKYSNSKSLEIKTIGNDILFINDGEKLKGDFQKYLEPFSIKTSNESFGLGLYIVFNILKANGYNLLYDYIDGKNIFTIKKDIKFTT
ncbi:ArsS family sensor histidine kinase [Aliarcobacter skirrowii]|uniref:ArsS family sensor histidine kinase n=1 Tax=Aliarcobacter skirrowii TaxID=28200 RepID=UPI00082D5BFD|nr:ArsS family sensor histidine kinase [Aliarcobacter skirrowii]